MWAGDIRRHEPRGVRRVSVREIREEERVIVYKHHEPIAVILSAEDGLDYILDRLPGDEADRIVQDLLRCNYQGVILARRELAVEAFGKRGGRAFSSRRARREC